MSGLLHCSAFSNTLLATIINLNLMTKSFLVLPLSWKFSGWFRRSINNCLHFFSWFFYFKMPQPLKIFFFKWWHTLIAEPPGPNYAWFVSHLVLSHRVCCMYEPIIACISFDYWNCAMRKQPTLYRILTTRESLIKTTIYASFCLLSK